VAARWSSRMCMVVSVKPPGVVTSCRRSCRGDGRYQTSPASPASAKPPTTSPASPASGRPSDAVLVSELPDVFGWREVAQVWSLGRAGAFGRLDKLLEEHLIRGAGHGRYSPIVPKSKVQSPESSPYGRKSPKSRVQSPESKAGATGETVRRRNRPPAPGSLQRKSARATRRYQAL